MMIKPDNIECLLFTYCFKISSRINSFKQQLSGVKLLLLFSSYMLSNSAGGHLPDLFKVTHVVNSREGFKSR